MQTSPNKSVPSTYSLNDAPTLARDKHQPRHISMVRSDRAATQVTPGAATSGHAMAVAPATAGAPGLPPTPGCSTVTLPTQPFNNAGTREGWTLLTPMQKQIQRERMQYGTIPRRAASSRVPRRRKRIVLVGGVRASACCASTRCEQLRRRLKRCSRDRGRGVPARRPV